MPRAAAPSSRSPKAVASPVILDRNRRFDVSFSAHAADLDGDGRADCVLLAGDQHAEDVRTQVLVFTQQDARQEAPTSPLFGPKGVPRQLLVVAGFAGAPDLHDVDGDRRPDLVLSSVRPDLIDRLGSERGSLEVAVHVYRNQGGTFSRRPDLTRLLHLPAEGLDRRSEGRTTFQFLGDITGDGASELLLREDPARVTILTTRQRAGELSIAEKPLFEMRVSENARLRIETANRLLVLEEDQVLSMTLEQ